MRLLLFIVGLALSSQAAQAQTWSELRAVRRETSVRIFEAAGKSWTYADGKLLLVKDNELTILRSGRPLVIPKAEIAKVETRRRDSPIEGALIGAGINILAGLLGGWQGCSDSKCAAVGIPVYAGLGALFDWQITTKQTVYRAP